ncbi:MAG: hypothetical protein JXA36_07515 [Coriobacteriia bacterium]|nr:hypothetical protein [Coriobacteriia bacterium]
MPQVPEWKKTKAFRMRLEHKTMKEVAKECHMSTRTVQQLESGWADKAGVRHPGWKEKLDRMWAEQEDEELKTGLVVKKERIKAYKKLAQQGMDLIEQQFPNIQMKNASDFKALLSEIRELCRLMSIELGEYKQPRAASPAKKDLSLDELQERYERAQQVKAPRITPPREARHNDENREETQADGE